MTATTVSIQVTCPHWCTISADEHRADLDNQEGRCIHHSAETEDGWGLVSITTPDGQLWADPGYRGVEVYDGGDCITLDEAEQRARSILALVQEGRRCGKTETTASRDLANARSGRVVIAQNVADAATSTGVSERVIREAVAKGELCAVRIGDRIVIRTSDLDEWVQSQPVVGIRR